MKSEYYHPYINTLKTLAILAVIAIHASGIIFHNETIGTAKWWIANIYNSCSRFCIPVFVMVSGALILSNNYSSTWFFLMKRFKRVAIPGIFWVTIYYIYKIVLSKGHFDFVYLIKIILQLHETNGLSFHFWFIPLILGLYLASPVIRIFIFNASTKMIFYFLFLWFCFSIFLPFIKTIYHIEIGIEPTIFVLYVGYFILGYFLHHSAFKSHNFIAIFLFLFCSICTSVGMFYLSSKQGQINTYFLGYGAPNVMLMSVSIFLLIKNTNAQFLDSSFLKNVGDAVFGIFLIHIFFLDSLIYAYNRLFNPMEKVGPLFGIPISVLTVFFLSLLLVLFLKKLPIIKHTV